MHKIEVPLELQSVDELIVPTSYPAKGKDDPALSYMFAIPRAEDTGTYYRSGSQPANMRLESNGSPEPHGIPNRIASSVSASAWGIFCWKKMAAGSISGLRKRVDLA